MTTPNLGLPELIQDQDQPHVTINTALRVLDCLTQLRVLDRDLTAPPAGSPSSSEGDCYIPAAPATGDWEGHEHEVAMLIGGDWVFRPALDGWEAWVVDEQVRVRYSSGSPSGWNAV